VTSGSYQRYYTVDGKKYHHIIHPDTLMPSDIYLSVSVICEDTALGDTLSTALFCMPLEEGKNLINTIPNAEALWLTKDTQTYTTTGWDEYVK
ncbi:MAG: FAD:protein FMN transferase, partial [Clostridia bacterium]|nr:FAD:protein FMN transferase [Clostridia bacterium]